MKKLHEKRAAELKAIRNQIKLQRDEVRAKYPFKSWTGYLQHLAGQGNETALAVLRSKSKEATVVKSPAHPFLSLKPKSATPSIVDEITELLRRESPGMVVKAPTCTIDGKGTVIIKLPDGGIIRDTGRQIHFSQCSEMARKLAGKLAERRWGRIIDRKGNTLSDSEPPQRHISLENTLSR
jgi:hypothetical protein